MSELVTRKNPLCDSIGHARIEHDFSLDYASLLSRHEDVERIESRDDGILYHLRNKGTIELRREVTACGKVVAYFNDCPKSLHDELISLEEETVKLVNEMYIV